MTYLIDLDKVHSPFASVLVTKGLLARDSAIETNEL